MKPLGRAFEQVSLTYSLKQFSAIVKKRVLVYKAVNTKQPQCKTDKCLLANHKNEKYKQTKKSSLYIGRIEESLHHDKKLS